MTTVIRSTHHIEVRGHVWISPLLVESKRTTRETGDEDDGGLAGVTSSLCPDLGAIRRCNVDGEGGGGERKYSEERSKLHDDVRTVTPQKGLREWVKRGTGVDWDAKEDCPASKYSPGVRTVVRCHPSRIREEASILWAQADRI